MFFTIQKKVALALYFLRSAKTSKVNSLGPSSKVSAIFFSFSKGLLQNAFT